MADGNPTSTKNSSTKLPSSRAGALWSACVVIIEPTIVHRTPVCDPAQELGTEAGKTACPEGTGGIRPGSPPHAQTEDGSVLEHVELIAPPALALGVVDREGAVADHAREGDAVVDAEVEAVAADGLPGEIAPDPKPADVATQEEFVPGRHRIGCLNVHRSVRKKVAG